MKPIRAITGDSISAKSTSREPWCIAMNSGPLVQESLVPQRIKKFAEPRFYFLRSFQPSVPGVAYAVDLILSFMTNGTLRGGRQGHCKSPFARPSADL